ARPRALRARAAFADVARDRAGVVPALRPAVLVARRAAVAEPAGTAMVDGTVPLPRHAAVRHPLGLPGVLGPHRLLRLPFHEPGAGRPRRPATGGRADVDRGDNRLRRGGNDREHAAPRRSQPSPPPRGGRLTMASERIAAATVVPFPRPRAQRATVASDY